MCEGKAVLKAWEAGEVVVQKRVKRALRWERGVGRWWGGVRWGFEVWRAKVEMGVLARVEDVSFMIRRVVAAGGQRRRPRRKMALARVVLVLVVRKGMGIVRAERRMKAE